MTLIFQETTRTRRLVGRIEDGEEFVTVLTDLCKEHGVKAGRVEAIGTFSRVELARFRAAAGDYQTVLDAEGCFELVSLQGNVSTLGEAIALRLECLLMADGPMGAQFVAGQLRSANAISTEFVLDIFEDLAIERRLDPTSGRLNIRSIQRVALAQPQAAVARSPTLPAPAAQPDAPARPAAVDRPVAADRPAASPSTPAAQPEPIAGKSLSWKDAVAEASQPHARPAHSDRSPSAREIYAEIDLNEPAISAGDILEHPKLGPCRIMKVEDGEFVHVRLRSGRIRKLSLDIVGVEFDREEDGRSVFRAVIGR